MTHAQVRMAEQSASRKKPYSAGLGLLGIISTVLSVLPAGLLAFDLLGYHARGHSSHPGILGLILLLGLSLAMLGQALGGGRNEGIRIRGWIGVIDVLSIRLGFAGIVFIGCVVKYALQGKHIPLYPVGVLTIASALFLAARLIAKFVFHMDGRRGAKI